MFLILCRNLTNPAKAGHPRLSHLSIYGDLKNLWKMSDPCGMFVLFPTKGFQNVKI